MKIDANIPFLTHFAEVSDPRIDRTKRHSLPDILFVCVCAVLCGADDCTAIALFAQLRLDWLRRFVALENGAPSHDTVSRVLSLIDPTEFEKAFVAWVAAIQGKTDGQIVAIDGKTMRASFDRATAQGPIHMVSAWGSANGLVLGQVKTDVKSNEITAIPKLLRMLDVEGCIVTLDALGSQKTVAEQIVGQKGDYVLALKGNHPDLLADVEAQFERDIANRYMDGNADMIPHGYCRTVDAEHGRIETRRCWCLSHLGEIPQAREWRGLRSTVMVEATREHHGKTSVERRYFITSLPPDASRILNAVRTHWGIENSLHWVLDVTFGEDRSRTRKDNGPQIRATLNRIAVNICRADKTSKASVKGKRQMAGWNPEFLATLIKGNV